MQQRRHQPIFSLQTRNDCTWHGLRSSVDEISPTLILRASKVGKTSPAPTNGRTDTFFWFGDNNVFTKFLIFTQLQKLTFTFFEMTRLRSLVIHKLFCNKNKNRARFCRLFVLIKSGRLMFGLERLDLLQQLSIVFTRFIFGQCES